MSPEASARAAQRRSAAAGETRRKERPSLSVLDRKVLARRARQRRERLLLAVSGLVVAGALGLVAAGQGVVTSQQEHLDTLHQQIATAVTRTQALQLQKARLAAPSRILAIAESKLHMVTPSKVTYLVPVTSPASSPGGTTGGRRRHGR